jgi:hypothetical protein
MTADLVTQVHQLEWEVLVGELRGIERGYHRLEELGILDKPKGTPSAEVAEFMQDFTTYLCWCGDPIRNTEYGWGHTHIKSYHHPASPTKPIRRQRKKKETSWAEK